MNNDGRAGRGRHTSLPAEPVVCLVCSDEGRPAQFCSLAGHLRVHGLTADEYRARYPGATTASPHHRAILSDLAIDRGWQRWTTEQMIAAYQRETRRRGYPLSGPQFERLTTTPSLRAVRNRFGSWNAFVEATGFTAIQPGGGRRAPRTRCRNGHRLAEAGVYVDPDGFRVCRECMRESSRRYRSRARAA